MRKMQCHYKGASGVRADHDLLNTVLTSGVENSASQSGLISERKPLKKAAV
jgi:hypothetical protein